MNNDTNTQRPPEGDRDETLEAIRTQHALIAHMRHELQTPLNGIIGYTELLLEDARELGEERFLPDLQKVYESGKQLLALIDDLLSPSKVQPSKADVDLESFGRKVRHDLRTPLNAVIGYSEMLLEDAEGLTHGDFIAELQKIHTAGQRMLALIDDITLFRKIEAGQISVDGVGAGISTIIRSVLTTVCPLVESGTQTPSAEQGRLLVVDDNDTNRDLLSRRLEREGYAVAVAEDGRRALEKLQTEPFDLVLLDLIMPGMNGYEVLQQLKSDHRFRDLPVIMISALDEIESVARCIERGAEDYLPKPFNPVLLKARIGACLEKKRLRDREVLLHQQLEENYNRLKELEHLRDSLTHMVVHDLRTPLTSVLTGLYTMEQVGELNPDQRELWQMGVQGGETLLGMINDLLDISKMEDGSLQLEYSSPTVEGIVERAIQQVAQLTAEKRVQLARQLAPDLPILAADEDKLRRTLVNLLGNAVKFSPSEGTITVSARLEASGAAVLFSVTDGGEGIPKEAFERIFEKFGQVESRKAGRRNSTGLGLTFCKMAVEAHGGRIWVESELGRGSTFLFSVPVVPAS